MTVTDALILGFLQGATEFLPVSSSGHLVVGQFLLGVRVPGVFFEVTLHLATLLSVVLVYRGRLASLLTGALRRDAASWRYLGWIVLATVPAALVGGLAGDPVERLFDAPWVAGVGFLVTGTLLWSSRAPLRRTEWKPLSARVALLIGLAQAFAIIPGVSRSGSTVVVALWLGIEAAEAAAFSFLMAIPAIAGAGVLLLPELRAGDPSLPGTTLALSALVAAVTGVLAITTFVAMLRRRAFHRFAWYAWALGIFFLVYLATRGGA